MILRQKIWPVNPAILIYNWCGVCKSLFIKFVVPTTLFTDNQKPLPNRYITSRHLCLLEEMLEYRRSCGLNG